MLRVTRIDGLKKGQALLLKAVERLEKGGLVAIPSECGYRWAVRSDAEAAVVRLKHGLLRPESRPLCLFASDLDSLESRVLGLQGRAQQLAQAFWPGPLVMLMRRGPALHARDCDAEFLKIGVRIPQHPLANEFLRLCPFPVLTGGAHGPGYSRLTRASHLVDLYSGRAGFVETGPLEAEVLVWKEPSLALEPTVVDVAQNPPRLIRSGFVGLEELRRLSPGSWLLSGERGLPSSRSRAPSEVHIIVVEGDRAPRRLKTLLDAYPRSQRLALLVTRETAELAFDPPPRQLVHFAAFEPKDDLFECIALAEKKGRAGVILVEGIPRQGQGAVAMEKLCRMAHEVVNTEDPGYRGQAGLVSKPSAIPG